AALVVGSRSLQTGLGVADHRPELVDGEGLAVPADPDLLEEERAAVLQLDEDPRQQEDRRGEQEAEQAEAEIDDPLERDLPPGKDGGLQIEQRLVGGLVWPGGPAISSHECPARG